MKTTYILKEQITNNINHIGEYLRDRYFFSIKKGLSFNLNSDYKFIPSQIPTHISESLFEDQTPLEINCFHSSLEDVTVIWFWTTKCTLLFITPEYSIINHNCSKPIWNTFFHSNKLEDVFNHIRDNTLSVIPPLPKIPDPIFHNPPLDKQIWLDKYLIRLDGWKPLMNEYRKLFTLFPNSQVVKTIYSITPQTYELSSAPTLLYNSEQIFYSSWGLRYWNLLTDRTIPELEKSSNYNYFSKDNGNVYSFEKLSDLKKHLNTGV